MIGLLPILFIGGIFWCFLIGKAIRAQMREESYVFAFWDGGLLFQGKEVSPMTMLIVYGLSFFLMIAGAIAMISLAFLT